MDLFSSLPLLWGQAPVAGGSIPQWLRVVFQWLVIFGEPRMTVPGLLGGLINWLKIISLFSLLGWLSAWLITAFKERIVARGSWLDFAALGALILAPVIVLLRVLELNSRIPTYAFFPGILGIPEGLLLVSILAAICMAVFFIWLEAAMWRTLRRLGGPGDLLVLLGIHLALALGVGVGFMGWLLTREQAVVNQGPSLFQMALFGGVRLSATYMGYVVLLRVLGQVLREFFGVRARRLVAIARLSIAEATRRMWAPWVVMVVFLVVLAFTHWFLQPPRPAEMGRLYVGTLILLCSLLMTVMITLLSPLSLPQDIQYQTIYTIVSKPVRRIELIWGRMLGYMVIVTMLVVVFGAISLLYLWRTVGRTIRDTELAAVEARKSNRITEARQLEEQAAQLRTRMEARVPIQGSLTFLDSRGTPHIIGIDIGQEQGMRRRSHIEGATPATAIWRYGLVPDPFDQTGRVVLDRRIPVDELLEADKIEGRLNHVYELQSVIADLERRQSRTDVPQSQASQLSAQLTRARDDLKAAQENYTKLKAQGDDLEKQAAAADKAGDATKALGLRRQSAQLHSPPIVTEMTFSIYRTTKGRIGEPVYAEIEVTNPRVAGASYRDIIPIREYYTNKEAIPSSILAGSGGFLTVEVRCISPTQYLGMAESDFFILAPSGKFGPNFAKGLIGVWLQAMVLTAIGVFAGTFLSWPVALLTTITFFVAGQVAFQFLLQFTDETLVGGGPFESLIRLLSHDNQVSDLAPTLAVVSAKTLDSLVMPVMSRLVYIVPNFSAFDFSNTVADGFAVSWINVIQNLLLALAYALPFSIAGYFILKHREVAA
jgi:ABC-type transport system involved in multi-copper enzyme maturation permease subunit